MYNMLLGWCCELNADCGFCSKRHTTAHRALAMPSRLLLIIIARWLNGWAMPTMREPEPHLRTLKEHLL